MADIKIAGATYPDVKQVNLLDTSGAVQSFTQFSGSYSDLTDKPQIGGVTLDGNKTAANLGLAAASHTHAAGDITSGTLGVARGGTGQSTLTSNAVLTGNGTSAIKQVSTASGALFATGSGNAPSFGTLPILQGGTGATTAAAARTNLDVYSKSEVDAKAGGDYVVNSAFNTTGTYRHKSSSSDSFVQKTVYLDGHFKVLGKTAYLSIFSFIFLSAGTSTYILIDLPSVVSSKYRPTGISKRDPSTGASYGTSYDIPFSLSMMPFGTTFSGSFMGIEWSNTTTPKFFINLGYASISSGEKFYIGPNFTATWLFD